MPYRGLNRQRQTRQIADMTRDAGFTGTWRKFVSADTGVAELGLNASAYYAERTITAQLGSFGAGVRLPEHVTLAGMVAVGEFNIVTREKMERRDEFLWRGTAYRVESDSVPAHIANTYITRVKRGN